MKNSILEKLQKKKLDIQQTSRAWGGQVKGSPTPRWAQPRNEPTHKKNRLPIPPPLYHWLLNARHDGEHQKKFR